MIKNSNIKKREQKFLRKNQMKKPNTIKIHKMLKEIYNMTQGGLTQ